MRHNPRRLMDDSKSYVLNNIDLAVLLLDRHVEMIEALRFYANGENDVALTSRYVTSRSGDWRVERKSLRDRGFLDSFESYDGTEWFLESGLKAQTVLDALSDIETGD